MVWCRGITRQPEDHVGDPFNPPRRNPERAKRDRFLGVNRGVEFYIEIFDDVVNRGVVVPFPEALIVAADINLEITRVFDGMVTHLDREDGMHPEWERLPAEWRKKDMGTEGLN